MVLDNDFKIKDFVYLKTDEEQRLRLVSGICVRDNGISYELCCGEQVTWHYSFEISKEKNILMTTDN